MKSIAGRRAAAVLLLGMMLWPTAWAAAPSSRQWLTDWGIEANDRKLVARLYNAVVQPADLTRGVGFFVAETDRRLRARAAAEGKSPQAIANLAGTALEYSLLAALRERGKQPLFWQAEFNQLPNNFYDVVFFTAEHGPVVLSPKTSLRERYKQADLEALALRGVFPRSRFYLISLDRDKNHIANVQRKIASGEVRGIVALYDETNLEELFRQLDSLTAREPQAGILRRARRIPPAAGPATAAEQD
jgi:hypothetical protein